MMTGSRQRNHWFLLAVTLWAVATVTLQPVTSQQVPANQPKDRSDEYMEFVQKGMIDLLRKNKASEAVLTQLGASKPWHWRTWDQNTKNKEFDTMLAGVRSTYRSRVPAGDVGTALSLTNCFVDNLGTGWYRVGDVIMSQSPTQADIKLTVANRSVKADCDYWFLGAGRAKANLNHVEIEIVATLNMSPGESPRITSAKVRQFSGVETDFGQGFWAPGINWVVGLVSTYSQDRIITELEESTPGLFQTEMNAIRLPQ